MDTMKEFGERVAYRTAGEAQREAMERLFDAGHLPPSATRVAVYVITTLGSYSRLAEAARVQTIADAVGLTREAVSRALNLLAKLNVIGWRAGKAMARSFIALAKEFLPGEGGDRQEAQCDRRRSHSNVTTPVTTVREGVNEETTGERAPVSERSSSSSTADPNQVRSDPLSADESIEQLTPWENHEVEAGWASDRLATHLFSGIPDDVTRRRMYRRFLAVPVGEVGRVLRAAVRGKPSRSVDCPHAYAVAWIATAERTTSIAA